MSHRWSGWPGAWCLDCGQEDANEVCIGEHDVLLDACPDGYGLCLDHPGQCPEHVNGPCLEPGSGRHDPYLRGARKLLLDLLRERRREEMLRLVDEWHNGDYPGPLCEYLAMSTEQYAVWVENADMCR